MENFGEQPAAEAELLARTSTPAEELLERREKTTDRQIIGGLNEVHLIALKDNGSAIFKPVSGEGAAKKGESERREIRIEVQRGTYYKRERAAYLVSRFLGFDLVPPTVIREIDGEIGSAQEFIPGADMGIAFTRDPDFIRRYYDDLGKLFVFDYIIWNTDRHWGNFLVKGERLYAIDNGFTFGSDEPGPGMPQTAIEFFNASLPQAVIERLENFRNWEDGQTILKDLLKELLPGDEVAACLRRIEKITDLSRQEQGTIPHTKKGEMLFSPQ